MSTRTYVRPNLVHAPRLEDTRLGGYAGELAERFFEERMLSREACEIFAEAESAFSHPVDDETLVGYWRGEFWGKLAISAARVCRYHGNEALRRTLRESAYRVLSFQRPNGYLGSYRDEDFVVPHELEAIRRATGQSTPWCWNIWCRKYTLWGLLECYELLGDEALRAKLIDRYAAFERLIAEKIAERTDVVSADYLSQLILLASDGMIVQEALRNDNFDAAAFVRQSEAYLRVLRPADRN